jgi:hypothetical protein
MIEKEASIVIVHFIDLLYSAHFILHCHTDCLFVEMVRRLLLVDEDTNVEFLINSNTSD